MNFRSVSSLEESSLVDLDNHDGHQNALINENKNQQKHIVLIGSSVLRFLYLSSVELLKYGKYDPSHSWQSGMTNWADFYQKSAAYFGDFCECFRIDPAPGNGVGFGGDNCCDKGKVMENRFYRGKILGSEQD